MMLRTLAALSIGLLVLSPACSSSSESDPGPSKITSQQGSFVASFVPDPDPAVVGDNSMDLTLSDAGGSAVTGATLVVEPWMPAHGHGSSTVPSVSETGGGQYRITQLAYSMPGRWEVRIDVTAGNVIDRLVLSLDVK